MWPRHLLPWNIMLQHFFSCVLQNSQGFREDHLGVPRNLRTYLCNKVTLIKKKTNNRYIHKLIIFTHKLVHLYLG